MSKTNKKLSQRRKLVKSILFFCCVIIAITIAFTIFCSAIGNGADIVSKRLSNDRSQAAVDGVNLILSGFVDQVNMLAIGISSAEDFSLADAIKLENTVLKSTSISHLGVLYTSGKSFSTCGVQLNQQAIDSISPAFSGKSFIVPLYLNDDEKGEQGEHPLIACAPIRKNKVIIGTVFVRVSNETLLKSFSQNKRGDAMVPFVVDSSLHNLFDPTNNIPQEAFSALPPEQQNRYRAAMLAGKFDTATFDHNKEVVTLRSTAHDGFFVLSTLSTSTVFKETFKATNIVLSAVFALMIIFSVVLFIIVRYNYHSKNRAKNASMELDTLMSNIQGGVIRFELDDNLHIRYLNQGLLYITGYNYKDLKFRLKNNFIQFIHPDDRPSCLAHIKQQAKNGAPIEMNCRILNKSGLESWFLIKGNLLNQHNTPKSYLCILTDITTMKQAEQELNMTMQRYSIVIEQSDSIIFEYSYIDESIYLSNKWNDKFDLPTDTKDFFTTAIQTKFIHPDDVSKAVDVITSIRDGAPFKSADVRLQANTGHYIWCTLKASAIFDENGKVYKTVGRIIDVNRQYNETEILKQKAELDSLTGIYNKATTQMLIDNFLELEGNKGHHALLIIDIDNFKQVNDTLGHLAGDAVIKEIAQKIKSLLRCGDIFGRIGGDEFVVLLKGAGNPQNVKTKAGELCATFIDSVSYEGRHVDISCSIGIAFYSKTSQSYEELVDKADTALYKAKKNGKNQFIVYGE